MFRVRLEERKFFDVVYPFSKERVLIEAPHAGGPHRDNYTGFIAWELFERYGLGGIISRTSRELVDFNRGEEENKSYQREGIAKRNEAIAKLFEHLGWKGEEPLLYLALHGVKDENVNRHGADFILGTIRGELCPAEFRDSFQEGLSMALKAAQAPSRGKSEVSKYVGHPSLLRLKELFGPNLFIIQLELSATLRKKYTEELISALFLAVKGALRRL